MLHLYDRATMLRALQSSLDLRLHALLSQRIAGLVNADHDITDDTEYLIIQPHDTEDDIVRHVGFSPLVEPIDGARFGRMGFHPHWDWLAAHEGWFEMIVTFGSTFAYVLFIQDTEGVLPELRAMCEQYS